MTKKIEFLYLNEEDMINAGVMDMHKCVEVMEEVFNLVGQGDYLMGGPSENSHGIKIFFPPEKRFPNMPVAGPDRRFMAMVAYLGGRFNVCGEKWYGSNIENPSQRGWPRSILLTVLNDPVSAAPLAIMSANLVSAMRTGAMPGLGAKYLAKNDAEVLGIIGGGVISTACLMSLTDVLKGVKEVKVYDIYKNKAEEFSGQMGEKLGIKVHAVDTLEEAVSGSDVINVATSGKTAPFIKAEWLKEGSLLTAPAGVELEEEYLLNSKVVVDEWKMHMTWREELKSLPGGYQNLGLPTKYLLKFVDEGKLQDEEVVSLGQVITGQKTGRVNDRERTVLMTGGCPVQDLGWSYTVYKNALEMGIGQKLTLWEEPHLF